MRFMGNVSGGEVIGQCDIGGTTIKAVKKSFDGKYVISIEGLGKPTIFGAAKFCAIVEMKDAIEVYFKEVGQIE